MVGDEPEANKVKQEVETNKKVEVVEMEVVMLSFTDQCNHQASYPLRRKMMMRRRTSMMRWRYDQKMIWKQKSNLAKEVLMAPLKECRKEVQGKRRRMARI